MGLSTEVEGPIAMSATFMTTMEMMTLGSLLATHTRAILTIAPCDDSR
jgi:hypothetical protein